MKLIYTGKTKDVYETADGEIVFKFKDDVTGTDGDFDPGADTVGLSLAGAGKAALKMSTFFFKKLKEKGFPTHFISENLSEQTMTVKKVDMLGKGLEFICRFKAIGSFYRRYQSICTQGQPLDALVEVTIKDDEQGDPLITADSLIALGILTKKEYDHLIKQTKKISLFIKKILQEKNIELYDIKLEFGRDQETGKIILIDEISGGNMRTYKEGMALSPLQLAKIVCRD